MERQDRSWQVNIYHVSKECHYLAVAGTRDVLEISRREEYTPIYRYCRQRLLTSLSLGFSGLQRPLRLSLKIPYEEAPRQANLKSLCD